MAEKTYFIVQPIEQKGKKLLPARETHCRSDEEAIARAERDARRFAGVIAFRQVADDETGELLEEPVILAMHGTLPAGAIDDYSAAA